MFTRIIACFLKTTLAFALLGPLAPAAEAQPDPATAFEAFRAVESRVRAWDAKPPIGIPCRGACITLRLDGETLARGKWIASTPDQLDALDRALDDALTQAARRITLPVDATRDTVLRDFIARMTIGIELSGDPELFAPEALADATLLLSPGIDGLAVRLGERMLARFPEQLIETNSLPAVTLQSLAADLAGSAVIGLVAPTELRASHGFAFYRFRVTHLAQLRPGASPEFLRRSGMLVPRDALSSVGIRAWVAAMSAHLAARISPAGEVGGAWRPWTADAETRESGLVQAGIVLLAQRRLADYQRDRDPGAAANTESRIDAIIASAAAQQKSHPKEFDDPAVAAIWAGALAGYVPRAIESAEACDRLRAASAAALDFGGEFADAPPPVRAAVVWGLARLEAFASRPGPRTERARAMATSLLMNVQPGHVVGLLPWIGWAQLELAAEDGPIPAAILLRQARAEMWDNQLNFADTGYDGEDLVGGLVFTRGGVPLPSWHTARPVAFAAAMLADPRLTPPSEVGAEIPPLMASLRFLRQLTADESITRMFRRPDMVSGGVRSALWDQRLAPEATAITLIAAIDTLESLEKIASRRAPNPPNPGP